jgi:antitoxin-like ribbon-helix-helix protein
MTKPKRKPLSQALEDEQPTAVAPVNEVRAETPPPKSPARQSDRVGKKNISAWFPLSVSLELEELRIERSRALGRKITMQELLGEAYNDLFKKYGRPELATGTEG